MAFFSSKEHEERFYKMVNMDQTGSGDCERRAMFYILSGCDDIYKKGIQNIYDFEEHCIKPNCIKKLALCSSSESLINLAFNLYNGNGKMTISQTFRSLDDLNAKLALSAIKVRYGI